MLEQLRQFFERHRYPSHHSNGSLDSDISSNASCPADSLSDRCVSAYASDRSTSSAPESDLNPEIEQQNFTQVDLACKLEEKSTENVQSLQLGHYYFEQNQFDEAITHYRHALEQEPNRIDIYQYLAETLSKVGNLAEAAVYYRRAIELTASPMPETQQFSAAVQQEQESQLENAACLSPELANQVIGISQSQKANGDNAMNGSTQSKNTLENRNGTIAIQAAEYDLTEAENFYSQGKWQETIDCCHQLLHKQLNVSAYKLLGNALQRLGQFSEAGETYLSALQLEPRSADIYANLGSLYAQQQRWQDAVAYYQKAIDLKPDFAGVHRNLAKVWLQLAQPDKAANCWQQAFTLEPEKVPAEEHINFGNLLLGQNQITAAIDCYRNAINLSPMLAGGYQNLAAALTRQGKAQEATPFYRKAQELGLNVTTIAVASDAVSTTNLQAESNGKRLPTNDLSSAPPHAPEQENSTIAFSTEASKQLEPDLEQTYYYLTKSFQKKEKLIEVIRSSTEALKQLEPELAQTCRDLAESFLEQEKLTEAIHCYQQLIELDPNSAADRINLGSLYAQQEQWQAAIACYESAIALDENLASAHWNLAKVWEAIDRPEQAAKSFLHALSLEPSWASLSEHLSLGHALRAQGNQKAAIACYQQVIQRDVTFAEAHAALGEIFAQQQQWQDSITHYRQAILYCRDNLKYLICLAQVFVLAQQWRKAVLVYRQIISRNSHPSHCLALAQCLEQQELWDEAIEAYQKLVAVYPRWQVHHKLGDLLNRQQRWQEAVVAFRQAIDLNPDYSWSHNNLGDALIHLEQWQEAAEAFQRAIELHPDFHWSHYNLGEALAKLEQWDGAIGAYRRAMQLQPQMPLIYQKLGDSLCCRAKADKALALNYYRKAIVQEPDNVQNYHKALTLEPSNFELHNNLADTLIRLNKLEHASLFKRIALKLEGRETIQEASNNAHVLEQQAQKSWSNILNQNEVLQIIAQSGLFDFEFYLQNNPDVDASKQDPIRHYIELGAKQGRNPSLLFNTSYYLEKNPDVADAGINPLAHYIIHGAAELRNPNPLFDTSYYLLKHPDVAATNINPLAHYILYGAQEGRVAWSLEQMKGVTENIVTTNFGDANHLKCLYDDTLIPSTCTSDLKIAVLYSSKGNYFMTEMADFLAESFRRVGIQSVAHSEQEVSSMNDSDYDFNLIVAPQEFFYLGDEQSLSESSKLTHSSMICVDQPHTSWFSKAFHFLQKAFIIFDINMLSAAFLEQLGLPSYFLPLGYIPNYKPFEPTTNLPNLLAIKSLPLSIRNTLPEAEAPLHSRPIDVYYIGTLNERREEFFAESASWLSQFQCFIYVPPLDGTFIEGEDQALDTQTVAGLSRRSKILLNIHRDELPYFEWHRIVLHGLWQRTLVVTEPCHTVPGLIPGEHFIECELDNMKSMIEWLLNTDAGRLQAEQIRNAGYEALRKNFNMEMIAKRILGLLLRTNNA